MIGKRILTAAGMLLLLPLAMMTIGCKQDAEQAEQSETPLRTVETAETEQGHIDRLVESYLDLRELLAQDQLDGVSEELAAISEAAQPLKDSDNAQVSTHAQDLAELDSTQPEDLEKAREQFEEISAALIELVQVIPPSDAVADTLHIAYCPMAEASWLQATEDLANPYMGQKMLKCGEVKETFWFR